MENHLIAKKRIGINAPISEVWNVLTDPKLIKKYFFGTNMVTNWRVGSPIMFKGTWEGKKYVDKGTILKFEPQRELQYNYWSSLSGTDDVADNYSKITYKLQKESAHTILTVTQGNCKTEETKHHAEDNWKLVLGNLKNIVERKKIDKQIDKKY